MNLISKIINGINLKQKFNFLFFYSGFDTIIFLEELLIRIKGQESKIIVLLNFDDKVTEILASKISIQIIKKENQARFKCYLKGGVIAITNKTFLLDLLTKKLSVDLIEYIIIGPDKHNHTNYLKEKFILELVYKANTYLAKVKFIHISNKPKTSLCSYLTYKHFFSSICGHIFEQNNQALILPRFHKLYDTCIQHHNVFEINILSDEMLISVKEGLIKLYELSYLELIKRISEINNDLGSNLAGFLTFRNIYLEDFDYLAELISDKLGSYVKILVNDLILIRDFFVKLEYLDYPSFYSVFLHHYLKRNKENGSIFSFIDLETTNLIEAILINLRKCIYRVIQVEENNYFQQICNIVKEINCGNCYDYEKDYYYFNLYRVIKTNETLNLDIIKHNELIIHDFVNQKMKKTVEILNEFIAFYNNGIENYQLNVLIYSRNIINREGLKEYIASCLLCKDKGKTYLENRIRRLLLNKNEYTKREKYIFNQKNIASEKYIEHLLIQLYMLESTKSFESFNQEILSKMLDSNEDEYLDHLPSELNLNENLFSNYNNNAFKPDRFSSNIKVFVENFNHIYEMNEFIRENKINTVIMYDYFVDIMRQLELNVNISKVYIINNVNSFQFYFNLFKLNNEKLVFSNLIKELKKINESIIPISINQEISVKEANILMDFREISSKLPYFIYKNNMKIISHSLEVGDYITCDDVCIERKSISTGDLFESLKNGRLISQIIKMKQYFQHNLILLEFEDHINVDLQKKSFYYRKIIELKAMFNNLHFLWSLSPKMSSDIIKSIKYKFNLPLDIAKCTNLNKNHSNNEKKVKRTEKNEKTEKISNQTMISNFFINNNKNIENSKTQSETQSSTKIKMIEEIENKYAEIEYEDDSNSKMKISIEKFLRKVDGISQNNISLVFKNYKNMKEFISSNLEKLEKIFGKQQGKKIYFFFTRKYLGINKEDNK
jgi:ERCC4-type nuclease